MRSRFPFRPPIPRWFSPAAVFDVSRPSRRTNFGHGEVAATLDPRLPVFLFPVLNLNSAFNHFGVGELMSTALENNLCMD